MNLGFMGKIEPWPALCEGAPVDAQCCEAFEWARKGEARGRQRLLESKCRRRGFGHWLALLDTPARDALWADALTRHRYTNKRWFPVFEENRVLALQGDKAALRRLVAALEGPMVEPYAGRPSVNLSAARALQLVTGQNHGTDAAAWRQALGL